MIGGHLIREARRRAGLSQADLAERLATSQSVVARWETGRRTPSIESVIAAASACDLDLHLGFAARDVDHDRLIDDMLRLTPAQRIEALIARLEAEKALHRARRRG
jgi:transcriptional regulator with XRE-family HTH domain